MLRLGTARLKSNASQMLFTPDGKTLITLDSVRKVRRWNAEDGRLLQEFTLPRPFFMPERLSRDGSLYVAGDGEGGLAVWNVASGQRMVQFPGLACTVAEFTPDGATVVALDCMGMIHLEDVHSGKERLVFPKPYKSWQFDLSPDSARAAVITEDAWVGLETTTGRELWRFADRPGRFVWSPDSATIAAQFESKEKGSALTIRFLNAADGTPTGRNPLPAPAGLVDMQFSPDGATLALRKKDEIVIWDLKAKAERRSCRWRRPASIGGSRSPSPPTARR